MNVFPGEKILSAQYLFSQIIEDFLSEVYLQRVLGLSKMICPSEILVILIKNVPRRHVQLFQGLTFGFLRFNTKFDITLPLSHFSYCSCQQEHNFTDSALKNRCKISRSVVSLTTILPHLIDNLIIF